MLRRTLCGLTVLALSGCPANTDLTVPPPPEVHPSFQVDVPAPLVSGRLPDWARPRRYALRMDIDPNAARFVGEVFIEVTLDRPTAAVVLHGTELEVRRAEVIVGEERIRAETSFRQAAGATTDAEELVVVTPRDLDSGTVTIHIEYDAALTDQLRGLYRVKDGDKAYVFTQFEPSDARRMFPCFDDPIYKVPFDVQVTVPKGNAVFSNTPETKRVDSSDGKRTTISFATSQPMPSYLVALAVGPLEVLEGPKSPVPIRVITVPGKSHLGELAVKIASEQLEVMAQLFGSPYPYEKLDLVAVPNFGPGAMENAGIITFREELLLANGKTASAKSKRDIATILAHELSHQWFGNLVTMKWWDDLWLNEGFASYMEAVVVDRWRPSMRAGLEMLSWSGWVMDYDALAAARAVRQPVSNTYQASEAFDGITYVKGASVIRMVHRWIGDEKFFDGIRHYLSTHAWRNATGSDLFGALAAASGQDVATVASSFLNRAGVPLVHAELVCNEGDVAVKLSQARYQPRAGRAPGDDTLWSIPVCVSYGKGAKESGERTCTLLSAREATLALPVKRCPGWLLPNAGYDGYYRYSMPAKQLEALAKATGKRDSAEKIGFVTNMWALVQAGEVPATKLLDQLRELKGEREREVVDELINTLHDVSDALVQDTQRKSFMAFASSLLLPTAKRLGWDNKPGDSEDDRLLRRSVLQALAELTEDGWMASEAKKRTVAFLADGSGDSDTAPIALRVSARRGDVSLAQLSDALKKAAEPGRRVAVVQALGSLGEAGDLQKVLAMVSEGTIRAQDVVYVMRVAIEWPDSRHVLIAWLVDNLADLAERFPGFGAARMVGSVRRLCDDKSIRAADRALSPVVRKIGASERRLQEAVEAATLCVDLRKRQAAQASSYLAKQRW